MTARRLPEIIANFLDIFMNPGVKHNLPLFSKEVRGLTAHDHVLKGTKQLIIGQNQNLRTWRVPHLRGFGKLQIAKFNFKFNLNELCCRGLHPGGQRWWLRNSVRFGEFYIEFLQRNCCQNSFDRWNLIQRTQLMPTTDPLSAIALEMASMDQDENLEDFAEVKLELPAVLILSEWFGCAVKIART
jgi:hypothetical protein